MKCSKCAVENKDNAQFCKKCGQVFGREVIWMPDWKWHGKALVIIYAVVVAFYFTASSLLHKLKPPYNQRDISPEMTPWIKDNAKK